MGRGKRFPFVREADGSLAVQLEPAERQLLGRLVREYARLLQTESQSSDPGVARLFPPAYREDPLRNLDFDRHAHDDLMTQRVEAVEQLKGALEATSISAEEAATWARLLNDIRLVLGTRLDLTEETEADDFQDDPEGFETYRLYGWLSSLVGALVEELEVH